MKRPLRPVSLPPDVIGGLWLSAMPGRFDPLDDYLAAAAVAGVSRMAAVVEPAEIAEKAPDYAAARAAGALPFAVSDHPIPDYGTPPDTAAFDAFVADLAEAVRQGETVAIHCAAGIGRTGLAAQRVLQALGLDAADAAARVLAAGSQPETAAQRDFLRDGPGDGDA